MTETRRRTRDVVVHFVGLSSGSWSEQAAVYDLPEVLWSDLTADGDHVV